MKNFLSLLCILSLCFGCDKAYDLNKIESGDVTIGNDQSEWIMPLAQITVGMDELQDGSADIRAIFDGRYLVADDAPGQCGVGRYRPSFE